MLDDFQKIGRGLRAVPDTAPIIREWTLEGRAKPGENPVTITANGAQERIHALKPKEADALAAKIISRFPR